MGGQLLARVLPPVAGARVLSNWWEVAANGHSNAFRSCARAKGSSRLQDPARRFMATIYLAVIQRAPLSGSKELQAQP